MMHESHSEQLLELYAQRLTTHSQRSGDMSRVGHVLLVMCRSEWWVVLSVPVLAKGGSYQLANPKSDRSGQ